MAEKLVDEKVSCWVAERASLMDGVKAVEMDASMVA